MKECLPRKTSTSDHQAVSPRQHEEQVLLHSTVECNSSYFDEDISILFTQLNPLFDVAV